MNTIATTNTKNDSNNNITIMITATTSATFTTTASPPFETTAPSNDIYGSTAENVLSVVLPSSDKGLKRV